MELTSMDQDASSGSERASGVKRKSSKKRLSVSMAAALDSNYDSCFVKTDEQEKTTVEEVASNIGDMFLANLPLPMIATLSKSKALVFGLIAYAVVAGIFLYFAVSGFDQTRKEEFVSLDSSAGECVSVERPLTGFFYASSDGVWQGNTGYQYTHSIYEYQFSGMSADDDQFYDTLMDLKTSVLSKIGAIQSESNLAYNLLYWMHFTSLFSTTGSSVQLFGFTGEPADVFKRAYVSGGIAKNLTQCSVYPVISFDQSVARMTMTYQYDEYMAQPSCYDTANPEDSLGWDEAYDHNTLPLEIDMISLTSAIAVNLGILRSVFLEKTGDITMQFEYGGVQAGFQQFYDTRFPGMTPYYCVVDTTATSCPSYTSGCYNGGNSSSSGSGACASCGYSTDVDYVNGASDCVSCQTGYEINVAFDDCTGSCVLAGTATNPINGSGCEPCGTIEDDGYDFSTIEGKCFTALADGSLAIPIFNVYQEDCISCNGSTGDDFCNDFDFLAGYIMYDDADYNHLFGLYRNYSVKELNDVARLAVEQACEGQMALDEDVPKADYNAYYEKAFEFCNYECFVVGLNPFDNMNQAVSPFFTEITGHCQDSVNTASYSSLASDPPAVLVEPYYRCKPTISNAFFSSIGIANGNAALFAPLICLLVLLPLIKFYYATTGQHLHEDEYTKTDHDKAASELGHYLLKVAHGKSKIDKHSVMYRLVSELKSMAAQEARDQKKLKKMTLKEVESLDRVHVINPIRIRKKRESETSNRSDA